MVAGETMSTEGKLVYCLPQSWRTYCRWFWAAMRESRGRPDTVNSTPLKGCKMSKSRGGVSGLLG